MIAGQQKVGIVGLGADNIRHIGQHIGGLIDTMTDRQNRGRINHAPVGIKRRIQTTAIKFFGRGVTCQAGSENWKNPTAMFPSMHHFGGTHGNPKRQPAGHPRNRCLDAARSDSTRQKPMPCPTRPQSPPPQGPGCAAHAPTSTIRDTCKTPYCHLIPPGDLVSITKYILKNILIHKRIFSSACTKPDKLIRYVGRTQRPALGSVGGPRRAAHLGRDSLQPSQPRMSGPR